ncbi:hypothetical protein L8R85_18105 [Vibrio splendidus]|jgi:hypothetical protein|uniref:Uncharacterized protein n=2 Tax=Vibrio TaxID=662 RepID=A0AA43FZY7_VIBSP|nr:MULTISPECIES: hypothetical protein [Vibrio]ANP76498.1 hypothetical protein A134_08825 [Vibrio crassostreae 9CS106]CAH6782631.1 conserved hypothetical protein [Vibrio chagasii]MDH5922942.1 hypothetical protein [Vibrio splendidus]MDL5029888.1 hypothetical protein [Vibrio sp. TMPB1044]MDN3630794.1 hypothetical protein [Vibrio lentus]
MKSFFDDLLEFGAGALDSVGENADWLFPTNDQSTNPDKTQQPNHPQVDNKGNTVTTPQAQPQKDNTMLYVGGGVGVLLVLILGALAFRR